jgi:glycosyltransferase involved in cell wall biosynthesis
MKVFEYMAVGKPIVASNSGQISDLLKNEESALLYEPGNISHMKEALFRLLNNADLQEKIARNAQQLFVEWHTWPHKARELAAWLKQCLPVNRYEK